MNSRSRPGPTKQRFGALVLDVTIPDNMVVSFEPFFVFLYLWLTKTPLVSMSPEGPSSEARKPFSSDPGPQGTPKARGKADLDNRKKILFDMYDTY
jgi:hypothetical protein